MVAECLIVKTVLADLQYICEHAEKAGGQFSTKKTSEKIGAANDKIESAPWQPNRACFSFLICILYV